MKFDKKLSYREISEKTGLTEGNVGYKLHHLIQDLAERIKIGRNHIVREEKMEERIIAYLLGECDEQEAFEVEKMCREDTKWQAEKIRYGQVLGLMEESISQTTPELLPEKEAKLTEDQRNEIKSLLATNSPTSAKIEDEEMNKNKRKENVMTDKQNKNSKNILGTTHCCCCGRRHYRLLWKS